MSIYSSLARLEREGEAVVLATVVSARGSVPRREGSKMLIYPDGGIEGTIGGGEMESRVIQEALQSLEDGKARLLNYALSDPERGDPGVCGGEMEVFVEPVVPGPVLVVVGSGHVGKAVAHLASWLGFRVVASDDRRGFATPEAVPDASEYVECPLAELPNHVNITAQTYVVLTTRGVPVDVVALPVLLDTPAAYIGVIGSRRRWETTTNQLLEMGVMEEKIARVISPMGLELRAETPEEIALSIMAEIIKLRRGGSGEAMAHRAVGRRAKKEG